MDKRKTVSTHLHPLGFGWMEPGHIKRYACVIKIDHQYPWIFLDEQVDDDPTWSIQVSMFHNIGAGLVDRQLDLLGNPVAILQPVLSLQQGGNASSDQVYMPV